MENTSVGNKIKMIRKEKGLTLEEFGKLVGGATRSNVSKWERGATLPNNERTKKIAELGNTSVEELLSYDSLSESVVIPRERYESLLEKELKLIDLLEGLR